MEWDREVEWDKGRARERMIDRQVNRERDGVSNLHVNN